MSVINKQFFFKALSDGSKLCFLVKWEDDTVELLTEKEYLRKRKLFTYKDIMFVPIEEADRYFTNE